MSRILDVFKTRLGNCAVWGLFKDQIFQLPSAGSRAAVHAPNHLGDTMMALPMVRSLLALEHFEVDVIAPPPFEFIWRQVDGVRKIFCFEPFAPSLRSEQIRTLREQRYALSFLLATGEEVAWMHWRAGIRWRVGFDFWGRGVLLNPGLKSGGPPYNASLSKQHMSENYCRLLDPVDLNPMPGSAALTLPADAMLEGRELLIRSGISFKRPIVALAPGANRVDGRLPPQLYAEVINKMREAHDFDLCTFGQARDALPIAQFMQGLRSGVHNFCGSTGIRELACALRYCDLFVGPDSGTGHLAAALGVSVLSLFTSGSRVWTRPLGEGHSHFSPVLECAPCFSQNVKRCDLICTRLHDPAKVAAAGIELLSALHRAARASTTTECRDG